MVAVKAITKGAAKSADLQEAVLMMTASMAEMSRRIAESNERTDRRFERIEKTIAELNERTDRRFERVEKTIAESNERTDQRIDKFITEARALIKTLSGNVGNVGNELGEVIEFITLPGIRHELKKYGHNFTRSLANKKINGIVRGEKQRVAEIDLFLHNTTKAMAIEVKTSLSVEDVNKHLDRLRILRKYEQEADLAGKKLYGAMIGIFVDFHARKLALKHGLYVLEILEEERKLKTIVPAKCRVW